jgi:hypothetical protein
MEGRERCEKGEEKKRERGGESRFISRAECEVRSLFRARGEDGERTWANEHSHAKSFARSSRRRHCWHGLPYMPPDFIRIRKAVMESAGLFDCRGLVRRFDSCPYVNI